MDSSQVLIALFSSITSVITAVVAGYYAVRVAQIERKRAGNKSNESKQEKAENTSDTSLTLGILILVVILFPIFFTLALILDWISGTTLEYLFIDTLDVTFISPIFFLVSYLVSTKLFIEKIDVRQILIPTVVIGLLITPFIFLVALTINVIISPEFVNLQFLLDPQNPTKGQFALNVGSSFDAMVFGGMAVILGFLMGASKKRIALSLK